MKLLKVAAAALNQTPLDWENNLNNIQQAIEQARVQDVRLLCLPELCITGYGCEDMFHATGVRETALEILQQIVGMSEGMVLTVGLPLTYAGGIFNAAAMIVDGQLIGFVAKQHLAGDGIHYETRWFKAWPPGVVGEVEIDGVEYPIGDLLFDVGGIRVGFEICEDAWVGARPGGSLASRGADIIFNPSASHFAFGKHEIRKRFVLEGSRAFSVSYVYANLVGNESGRAIFDGDTMIASGGRMIATGHRLRFDLCSLVTATVNVEATRMTRARTGSFKPDVDGDETDVIEVAFSVPTCPLTRDTIIEEDWEEGTDLKAEEFCRAVALGLFDYMRKSFSRGFVVSLSGGCDSASVVALVHSMFRIAEGELGFNNLIERIRHCLPSGKPLDNVEQLTTAMLTTAYQATDNSGDVTRTAAADLAAEVGATHYEFDVQPMVDNYRNTISEAIGTKLNWDDHDLTLQNIQARVRSPSIWMLANLNNALLLSTSNRSEAAVGYATMDGDTSGGVSPIAGIDKDYLRKWLVWMEKVGPVGVGPLPSLSAVNVQQPTAELRPPGEGQTDEGDLMPYDILDAIERLAIRDKLMPIEVFDHMMVDFADVNQEQMQQWIERFFRLWSRNQWKRERYAPSFHLDDESLDPKTWCRFPILSGGYRRELEALRVHVERLS